MGSRRKLREFGRLHHRALLRLQPRPADRDFLYRHTALDVVARKDRICRPVEADGIHGHLLLAQQPGAHAARKSDDPGTRNPRSNLTDDPARRLDAPALKLLRRQASGPSIEDLDGINTSLHLPDQVFRGKLRPADRSTVRMPADLDRPATVPATDRQCRARQPCSLLRSTAPAEIREARPRAREPP